MSVARKKQTGFTIVELLIVIVVIGILAAITIIAFNGAQRSAAIALLQVDLRGAADFTKSEAVDTGSYPADLTSFEPSEGTTVEYTLTGATYCITVSSARAATSFFYESTTGDITEGTCPDHTGFVSGGPSGPDPARSWATISVHGFHKCAIINGQAYCWGGPTSGNAFNGLGNGVAGVQALPGPVNTTGVLAGKTVEQISAGGAAFTCAIADGEAFCWGSNTSGQLGRSLTTSTNLPAQVSNTGVLAGRTLDAISSGGSHVCVLSGGQAFCWGRGTDGSLGRGFIGDSNLPVAVVMNGALNGLSVAKISSGSSHTCAVAGGQAFCWGSGTSGRLGTGNTTQQTAPTAVSVSGVLAGRTVTDISAGGDHTCAIADGQAFCWGYGLAGRLGDGGTTDRTTPVAVRTDGVMNGVTLTNIVAGSGQSCALGQNRVFCWGSGGFGALGNGSTANSLVPIEVPLQGLLNGRQIVELSSPHNGSCVILSDGQAYCWGYNRSSNPLATGTGALGDVLTPELLIAPWL